MIKLAHLSTASLFTLLVAGCAVSTAPDGTSAEPGTQAEGSPERANEALIIKPICLFPPITPMPGEWSCGSSGTRTGDKNVTTTTGYTNNCAGRATVELSIPGCTGDPQQQDEIHIMAVDTSGFSATTCVHSYLDYTIAETNRTTGQITTGANGRVYGTVLNDGSCDLAAPVFHTPSSEYSLLTISADAYEVFERYIFPVTDITIDPLPPIVTPININFDASFIQ